MLQFSSLFSLETSVDQATSLGIWWSSVQQKHRIFTHEEILVWMLWFSFNFTKEVYSLIMCVNRCGCAAGAGRQQNNNDAYLADLLRMTDQKLLDLQQEAERSQRQAKEYENQCSTLRKQVSGNENDTEELSLNLTRKPDTETWFVIAVLESV